MYIRTGGSNHAFHDDQKRKEGQWWRAVKDKTTAYDACIQSPFQSVVLLFLCALINTRMKRLNQHQFQLIIRFELNPEKSFTLLLCCFFLSRIQIVNLFNDWTNRHSIGLDVQTLSSSSRFQSAFFSSISTWLTSAAGMFHIRFAFPCCFLQVSIQSDVHWNEQTNTWIEKERGARAHAQYLSSSSLYFFND